VLLNLLANAVKFTPPGGAVRDHASCAAERITIAIADTGIGIAASDCRASAIRSSKSRAC